MFLYLFICTHLQQWQNAEQAEEHKERQRQRERETVLGTILHISNNEGSREAHKPTLNHHRDSEPGHNTATGSSGGAGNDAGGERTGGARRGHGIGGGGGALSRPQSPDRSRWQTLPRYDTGQGGEKGGVGGGRKFVAKELEYGFREHARETSLPPPATDSSTLLQNVISPRTRPPPPRPIG